MKLKFDLHTHTVFSHGKGSMEDNIKVAIAVGLDTLGISDHGPGHVTYGINRLDIPVMRAEISRLQPLYPQIKLMLGVEANIMNQSGHLDLTKDEAEQFDYINAGYHYGVFGENPVFSAGVHLKNLMSEVTRSASMKTKSLNTNLIIKAIYENKITVLTHPGAKAEIDIEEIAKACSDRGTYMEINDGHSFLSIEGIKLAAKTSVQFVISSDAHIPDRVGRYERALDRAMKADLDLSRIVNLEV